MYGNYLRAWRLALSPNDSVTISRTHFLTACSNLGFKDAGKAAPSSIGSRDLRSSSKILTSSKLLYELLTN